MKNGYLIPCKEIWIWENPKEYRIFYGGSTKGYVVNEDALFILKLCNGKRKVEDIIQILKRKKMKQEDISKVENFIEKLISLKILELKEGPTLQQNTFPIVGRKDAFEPIHAIVELCDCCNLECSYCYRNSSPSQKNFLKDPVIFLSKLFEKGVRVVELSGGEPLLHPQISRILKFSCKTFLHVSLLTNGVFLTKEILEILENFKDKISLQISFPSISRYRYFSITGKDLWNKLQKNLELLKTKNITFRIAMVLTDEESISEMEKAVTLAYSIGAVQFICQPFINIGRAVNLPSFSLLNLDKFVSKLRELCAKFPKKFLGIFEGEILEPDADNCGAGSKSIVFDPMERMRPCPMFPENFSTNALSSSLLRLEISKIISPRESICGSCEFLFYCAGCILRGYIKYNKSECRWGNSQKIDRVFEWLKS